MSGCSQEKKEGSLCFAGRCLDGMGFDERRLQKRTNSSVDTNLKKVRASNKKKKSCTRQTEGGPIKEVGKKGRFQALRRREKRHEPEAEAKEKKTPEKRPVMFRNLFESQEDVLTERSGQTVSAPIESD